MSRWRRSSHPRLSVVAGGSLLIMGSVGATGWLLGKTSHDDGAGIANVLALPLSLLSALSGIAALAIALRSSRGLSDPAVLAGHARTLLQDVSGVEARALAQLLGDTGDPLPADVGFTQPEANVRWRSDGGDDHGSLSTIADYYRSLRLGRLVLLGEAGSGKTVLALRLLLDLAKSARTALHADPTARVRVPVRLSLPSFTVRAGLVSDTDVRRLLDRWLVTHLAEVHNVSRTVAAALVNDGWVLPVLDGLDEMDSADDDGPRARQVMAALNTSTGPTPDPIVVTCRTDHYTATLQDATAVVIQPLEAEQIITWLTHRFPESHRPGQLARRWQPVATTMRRHRGGRLATSLASPLHLYLAATIYADRESHPARLRDLDAAELNRHLFDELVPAVTRHHPRPNDEFYDPAEVQRWLTTLADHLSQMAHLGQSRSDIHLQDLWRTAAASIRTLVAAITVTMVTAVLSVLYLNANNRGLNPVPETKDLWILLVLGVALIPATWFLVTGYSDSPPYRFNLSELRTRRGRRQFVSGLTTGFFGGILAMMFFGILAYAEGGSFSGKFTFTTVIKLLITVAIAGILLGVLLGLLLGLVQGIRIPQVHAARPSDPIRWVKKLFFTTLVIGGLIGVFLGVITETGGLYRLASKIATSDLTNSVVRGIISGLIVSFMAAFIVGGGVRVLRFALAVRFLRRRKAFTSRPGQFLDWAYTAGLVRLAGIATQFRHRELQTWFTSESVPQARGRRWDRVSQR